MVTRDSLHGDIRIVTKGADCARVLRGGMGFCRGCAGREPKLRRYRRQKLSRLRERGRRLLRANWANRYEMLRIGIGGGGAGTGGG
jgi:hypothetical protein